MLHFGRRDSENLSSLTRMRFAVRRCPDDKLYVYKVIDEQTKNNQSDSESSDWGSDHSPSESKVGTGALRRSERHLQRRRTEMVGVVRCELRPLCWPLCFDGLRLLNLCFPFTDGHR